MTIFMRGRGCYQKRETIIIDGGLSRDRWRFIGLKRSTVAAAHGAFPADVFVVLLKLRVNYARGINERLEQRDRIEIQPARCRTIGMIEYSSRFDPKNPFPSHCRSRSFSSNELSWERNLRSRIAGQIESNSRHWRGDGGAASLSERRSTPHGHGSLFIQEFLLRLHVQLQGSSFSRKGGALSIYLGCDRGHKRRAKETPVPVEAGDCGKRRMGEELKGLSPAKPIMSAAGVGGHTDCSAGESSEQPRG
ncbi:hypothetical protein DBV15_11183 [Temnothorax longispinosus]|uniref:Uncharacterized protein n=1 Tax=Temnothorax longispinosus TaxID=300112 RepID=A0A4S2KEP6_9HYME|nr:hypothetical protein DBV15_11183 [Temnothorax longispinosus]